MCNTNWAALGVALLATTALTTSASAAEWTASISGSAEVGIAYVSVDDDGGWNFINDNETSDTTEDDYLDFSANCGASLNDVGLPVGGDCENIGLINDGEIDFDFELRADNGITFGYHMELENEDTGAFDEYYAYVSGAFGTFELGQQDGAADSLLLTPPGCSYSCPGDGDGYLFDHFSNVSNVSIDNDGYDTEDALKLTYYTPKFSGFQAGVSFIPNDDDREGVAATDLTSSDGSVWEFGARWQGDLTEDVDLGVSANYVTGDDNSGASEGSWAIAAELGLFGGAIGARYAQNNSNTFADGVWWADCVAGECEESSLSIGAEYGTGPWGFFVNWAQTLDSDSHAREGDWGVSAEVDYAVAPGVDAFLIAEYGNDGGTVWANNDAEGADFDSEFAIGMGLGLSF